MIVLLFGNYIMVARVYSIWNRNKIVLAVLL